MQENILLAIVLPLVNDGEYFVGYCLAISEAREYFVGYCLAITECWRIFFLTIVLPLVKA